MYESPITRIVEDIQSQIIQQDEEHLMQTVSQAVGYKVDKEELLKALQYDRNQYDKGYQDAKAEIGTCKICKYYLGPQIKLCELQDMLCAPEPDFYCADFERADYLDEFYEQIKGDLK